MRSMAEREGFEPSVQVAPDNCLAGSPVRPLQHLSRGPGRAFYSPRVWESKTNLTLPQLPQHSTQPTVQLPTALGASTPVVGELAGEEFGEGFGAVGEAIAEVGDFG